MAGRVLRWPCSLTVPSPWPCTPVPPSRDKDKKPQPFEVKISDFDGASFQISVPDKSYDKILLSLGLPCFGEIKEYAVDAVNAAFPGMVAPEAASGYDITLDVPESYWKGNEEKAIEALAHMKRVVLGSVFEKYYAALSDVSSRVRPCPGESE